MKKELLNFLTMLCCIVYACAMSAQTNEVATPKFSADIKDVVSMYFDENAETFYLHSESTKYTLSKEGDILSEEPCKATWACWEDGVMYTHSRGEGFILNQKGDSIGNDAVQTGAINMCGAQPMFRKDGVFYWWWGPASQTIAHRCGIYTYREGEEITLRQTYPLYCTGLVVIDNKVLCTAFDSKGTTFYTIYYVEECTERGEWGYADPIELYGLKYPVGLSLVGDTFYIWSNETRTMYTIPKSFFGGVAGIQNSLKELNLDADATYTLDGRPVDGTQKGIYIKNGKKVLVK